MLPPSSPPSLPPLTPPPSPVSPPSPPNPSLPPPCTSCTFPLGGDLYITFNGEKTASGVPVESLFDPSLRSDDTHEAKSFVDGTLEQLSTIGSVSVEVSVEHKAATATVELTIDVHFHSDPDGRIVSPQNLGPLPLLELDVGQVSGLVSHSVETHVRGEPAANFTFPEQVVRIDATADVIASLEGNFTMSFSGATTTPLTPNSSATEMREALMALDTVGELEVFLNDNSTAREWLIRFYTDGKVAHIGKQPAIAIDASSLSYGGGGGGGGGGSGRRRLISVPNANRGPIIYNVITSVGNSPHTSADDLTDDDLQSAEGDPVEQKLNNESTLKPVTFTAPVYVCGDGRRSTNEMCDDNNTIGGDGCE